MPYGIPTLPSHIPGTRLCEIHARNTDMISVKPLATLPSKDPFQFVSLSDVETVPVDWLWKPYIPRGALTLLMGDGGYGKSWMTCALAADLSNGIALPGQDPLPPQRILMISAEDGISQVIKPKMELLGANMDMIRASDKGFELDGSAMVHLVRYIEEYDVAIVFLDPLVVYLGGKTDMNRSNEVRAIMSLLVDVAKKTNTAIVAVHHVRKGGEGATQHKVMGSADFVNGVRSTLLVDISKGGQRYMSHVKSNWAAHGPTLAYNFGKNGFTWSGFYDGNGSDPREVSVTRKGEVEQWIKSRLRDGPKLAVEMIQEATVLGYKERTLARSKNGLVKTYNSNGMWVWELEEGVLDAIQREEGVPAGDVKSIISQMAEQAGVEPVKPQVADPLAYARRILAEKSRGKVQ